MLYQPQTVPPLGSPRIVITPAVVRSAKFPPGSNQKWVAITDDEVKGFQLRLMPSGDKAFWVKYSLAGKQKYKKIGVALPDADTIKRARVEAERIKQAAKAGRDTVAAAAEAEAKAKAQANRQTIGELVPQYVKAVRDGQYFPNGNRKPRDRTIDAIELYLLGTKTNPAAWASLYHRYSDEEIERTQINKILDGMRPVSADRARSALNGFFNWAIDKEFCKASPIVRIRNRGSNTGRERVLTKAELRQIWQALGDGSYGRAIKLLILTGQRAGEIGGLHQREINLEAKQIELPGDRTKNGNPHLIPMSSLVLDLIVRSPTKPYICSRWGNGPFKDWSASKRELDAKLVDVPHWVVHDLRRTFVSTMAELRLGDRDLIELIVNHASGSRAGTAGVYNRSQRIEERREALEMWSQWIAENVAT